MAYLNPYGDDSYDPDAVRRKALLDLMGTPAQGASPTASQTLPSSRPAPNVTPTGTTRATAANGADTPDLPDPTPAASATPAPTNPYVTGDGRQSGTKILDLYDDPYTRRDTYGGWDPKRKAISSALVSSGNPYAMAAGAIGYIDAWAHRKAESAPTDFSLEDATQIIKDAYRDMNGHDISDQELNDALTGQGLRSGSHWVGQAGLQGVLGHLAENAAFTRAQGGDTTATGGASPAAAASTASAGTTVATGATPGGALASNPNTGFAGGMNTSVSGPSGSAGGGGGVPGNVEGVDAGKWGDPNKHDPKYDVLHLLAQYGSLDAAMPEIQKLYPNAKKVGGDTIDMGDGVGPVDIQRDSDHGGPFHWEPVNDGANQSAASAAPVTTTGSSPLASPGAAQLAAPLGNNDVLQQIMEELRRIQSGEAPRNALLQQMGLA
jgi:hypothetical protein